MTCNVTVEDYARSLKQLLPPGPAWQYDEAETLAGIMLALAATYNALHDRSCDLLREMIPDTTAEMLTDWERVAGLPDDCAPVSGTLEQRRNALVTHLRLLGGQSPQYYISLAASLGFAIEVYEYQPFQAGLSVAGNPITNDQWTFVWRVKALTQTVFAFKAGLGRAGEPLRDWGNNQLECVLNKWKPAHTFIIFDYGDISYV